MTFSQVKTRLRREDWYLQAAAAKRLYISYPFFACLDFRIGRKKIPVRYNLQATFTKDFMDDYLSKKSLRQVALYYYGRQKADRGFIAEFMAAWHRDFVRPYLAFNRRLLGADLRSLPDGDLFGIFRDYSDVYLRLWQEAIFLDAYDYYGEIILESEKRKDERARALSSADSAILTAPPRPSFSQNSRLAILRLTERILIRPKDAAAIRRGRSLTALPDKFFWLREELEKISRDFHWLINDFTSVEYLSPAYYYRQVRRLVIDSEKLREEREMKRELALLSRRQASIIRRYGLSQDLADCGRYLGLLGNFRDARKSYNQMASRVLLKFVREFARREKLSATDLEHLFFWELFDLRHSKVFLDRLAKRRRQTPAFCHIVGPAQFTEFFGKDIVRFDQELKARSVAKNGFRGQPACPGLVRGIVRIIKDKHDFSKMRPGNILVAPNTRPEYMPIMKMAGAIVSEEGGLTCHAAIVSRELKIPSLVGVQGATATLHDGDLIEVDASGGVIHIIK